MIILWPQSIQFFSFPNQKWNRNFTKIKGQQPTSFLQSCWCHRDALGFNTFYYLLNYHKSSTLQPANWKIYHLYLVAGGALSWITLLCIRTRTCPDLSNRLSGILFLSILTEPLRCPLCHLEAPEHSSDQYLKLAIGILFLFDFHFWILCCSKELSSPHYLPPAMSRQYHFPSNQV